MNYRPSNKERFRQLTHFVVTHLDEELSVARLAKQVHMSQYHFHRLFRAMMGETVAEFVLRIRMEKACWKILVRRSDSILEVALSVGFSDPSAFSRAFKRYFGLSPSALRRKESTDNSKISTLQSRYGKEILPEDLYPEDLFNSPTGERIMDVKIENWPKQRAACVSSTYERESTMDAWMTLYRWYQENEGEQVPAWNCFGLYRNDPAITPAAKCVAKNCLIVAKDAPIDSFEEVTLPAGRYAKVRYESQSHEDEAEEERINERNLHKLIQSFYKSWLADSPYEPDDLPLVMTYETAEPLLKVGVQGKRWNVKAINIAIKIKS